MKFKQFGTITLLSLPFTVLSHISSPLSPNFSIFSASPAVAQTSDPSQTEVEQLFRHGPHLKTYTLIEQGIRQYETIQIEAYTSRQFFQANTLTLQGNQQYANSQFEAAIQSWQQALIIYQEIGDLREESMSLNNLGEAYLELGEYKKAIDFIQQSLQIERQIGNRWGRVDSLESLANFYGALEDHQKEIDFLSEREVQFLNRNFQKINIDLSPIRASDLSPMRASDFFMELEMSLSPPMPPKKADILIKQGSEHFEANRFEAAIQSWQQALIIYQEIGDHQEEAISLNNLGYAYHLLRDYQKAINFYKQSLAIFQQIGNHEGEAKSLNDLGNAYGCLGDHQKAIDFFQQSLLIAHQIGNRWIEADSLGNLGSAYHFLGNSQKAIDYHQQSLEISQQIGNRQGEAHSLIILVMTYLSQGDHQRAIDFLQQSLAIFQQIGNRKGEAASLRALGDAYLFLRDHQKAINFLQQSLQIEQQIGNHEGKAASLGSLGNAYRLLGDHQKAIDFFQQSLDICQQTGSRPGKACSLEGLGLAFFESGNLTAAETTLKQAMKVYESLRVGLEDKYKISIFERHSNTYQMLQQVLVAQNKTNDALEIAERGRARVLVELLKQNSSPQSDTQPLKNPSLEQIKQIAGQQNTTLVEYSIVSSRKLYIWVISPTGKIEFRAVDLPQETSLKELVTNGQACILLDKCRSDINQTLPTIGDWVKLKDDQFSEPWQVVSIEQNTLKLRLESWEKGTTIQRPITDVVKIVNSLKRQHLQQLHQLLIQPIADLLPKNENDRIVFIPHKQLFLVPFPALQDEDGKYLIEKHTILTAQSIQVLSLTRKKRQQLPDSVQGALVVGNPTMPKVRTRAGKTPEQLSNLPHAETEAVEIAQLLNTQPLTGNSATKAAIVPKLPQTRIIHLATHGLLDDFKGLDIPGAIALAPSGTGELNDGLLTAGELFDMELNAELVVLSACKTGQGEITSDGVIGLSRSLIAAGVPSIIVSLWSVPDAPTADLMTRFYQHLAQNHNKAQALRQAMLDTMKEHPNPKDWAAFTLIGEP